MWCTVYPLYANGKRLPTETAKAGGRHGWLHMMSKMPGTGMTYHQARLLDSPDEVHGKHLLLPLDGCELRAITGGGIRLVGHHPWHINAPWWFQSWWCVPDGMEEVPA